MYYRRYGFAKRRYGLRRRRFGARTRFNRKYARKTWRVSRPVLRPHYFKRTYQASIGYSSGETRSALSFQLVDLPDVAEYQNMFDSYILTCVVLRFYNPYNSVSAETSVGDGGRLHYVLDYNDGITPTSIAQLMEYGTYKCKPLDRCNPLKIVIRPKLSVEYYRSLATTGYGTTGPKWIDTTNTGIAVPHFGFKYIIEAAGITTTKDMKMIATYYFKCKYTK